MTSLTTPDGIVRWTIADPASIVAESVAQGDSIQLALSTRQAQSYRWADAAARIAQTGMLYGATGLQVDTGVEYQYDGSAWLFAGGVSGSKTVFARAASNLATSTSAATLVMSSTVVNGGHFSHSAGTLTCLRGGTYIVTSAVNYPGNATGSRTGRMVHSAGGTRTQQLINLGGLDVTITVQWVVAFAQGDTLVVQGQQNSGGNLAVAADVVFEQVL